MAKLRSMQVALALGAASLGGTALAQTPQDPDRAPRAVPQAVPQEWSAQVVRQVEQALAQRNFTHGAIDGRMDPDTHYGLRQFQAWDGLAITGGINIETLAALGIQYDGYTEKDHRTVAERAGRPIGREFSPTMVRRAEQALAQKQFVTGPIDGVLDADTRFGLRNFQDSRELAATGDLNMKTLEALGVEGRMGRSSASTGASASGGRTLAGETLYTEQNIRAVEQALKDRNYVVGPVNAEIEPDTQYGLRQFQRDQGLAATGNFNFQTLERLGVDVSQQSASAGGGDAADMQTFSRLDRDSDGKLSRSEYQAFRNRADR